MWTRFFAVSDWEVRGQVCWERAADRRLVQSDQKHSETELLFVCVLMLRLQPTLIFIADYFSPLFVFKSCFVLNQKIYIKNILKPVELLQSSWERCSTELIYSVKLQKCFVETSPDSFRRGDNGWLFNFGENFSFKCAHMRVGLISSFNSWPETDFKMCWNIPLSL